MINMITILAVFPVNLKPRAHGLNESQDGFIFPLFILFLNKDSWMLFHSGLTLLLKTPHLICGKTNDILFILSDRRKKRSTSTLSETQQQC